MRQKAGLWEIREKAIGHVARENTVTAENPNQKTDSAGERGAGLRERWETRDTR